MSFDIEKCGMCGKAFIGVKGCRKVCENCREEEQQLYKRVRALIQNNPEEQLTIQDVSEKLKVEGRKITHLVDSGDFQLVKDRRFLGVFNSKEEKMNWKS